MYLYIFGKLSLFLGFSFHHFYQSFRLLPQKKPTKRKRRTQAGIIGEPLKRKLYYSLETLPHARAREKPLTQRKERERERKKERATLAEAVGREDPGESEKN